MLILLANGTFPEVWMAPPMVRDLRGLVRTRLAIRRQESAMKNRVHGVLNQYGLKNSVEEEDDVGKRRSSCSGRLNNCLRRAGRRRGSSGWRFRIWSGG